MPVDSLHTRRVPQNFCSRLHFTLYNALMPQNSYIDLTTLGSSPSGHESRAILPPNEPPLHVSGDGHDYKKRRLNSGAAAGPSNFASIVHPDSHSQEMENINPIDLTEADDVATFAQSPPKPQGGPDKCRRSANDNTRSLLVSYKCPVCMDVLVDATVTICGHLFCHKCIIDTLRFGEERLSYENGKQLRGNCPVCRKTLSKIDVPGPRRNLIPLDLKIMTRKKT
ncbi:hypothetical protein LOZ45_004696 [Ophidiomyces ophidiicola]|nr:hypothetical protein LOZ45_004696 [Ophidiomyces ophidiicola]KAI2159626.1 hypothetical protein LOZ25_002997 [Ophidiomyces ophidiicola]